MQWAGRLTDELKCNIENINKGYYKDLFSTVQTKKYLQCARLR